MSIREDLFKLRDEEYAKFQAKIAPTIDPLSCIGVRLPDLRAYAKRIVGTDEANEFLKSLPHKYYDENLLHSILLLPEKNFDKLISEIDEFLPYIDNWAVCDTLHPKVFKKHRKELLLHVKRWMKSDKIYTIRFSITTLMDEFLEEDFSIENLEMVSKIRSSEYYVNMAIAWFFATSLAKQWENTLPFILDKKLDTWTHNKTIQKAKESFRITDEQKACLNTLKT